MPPFVDQRGIQANFDPNYRGPGANGQGAVVVNNILLNVSSRLRTSCVVQRVRVASINPNYNAATCTPVVTNADDGVPAGLQQTYLRNFDPRISMHTVPQGQ